MSEVALPTTTEVATLKPGEIDISAYAALVRKEKVLYDAITEFAKDLKTVQSQIQEAMGESEIALIDGRPAITYSRIEKLRGKDLEKDYPIIYEACSKDVVKHELDPDLLKLAHPEIYRQYQSRQFKRVS